MIAPLAVALLLAAAEDAPAPPAPEGPGFEAVVTGTRLPRPVRDTPTPVVVVAREEIARSATVATDDLLRTVPSAATFRRSSSLVADPSAQGLSLRGVGPSGTSRALLLLDGVPANDPFGGWIYWRRAPRLAIGRVEVAPGGGSALYGDQALGGVVQVLPREIEPRTAEVDVAGGTRETAVAGARVAHRAGAVGAALAAEALTTGGFVPVSPAQRGAVDVAARSAHAAVDARVEAAPREGLALTAGGGLFAEDQEGGTRHTTANVRLADGRARARLDRAGWRLELLLHGALARFGQDRARIAAGRASESLAARQRVPAHQAGGSFTLAAPPRAGHALLAGVDARRVAGTAVERLFPASTDPAAIVERESGGAQRFVGVFLQDLWSPVAGLELSAALRLDAWRNEEGRQRTRAAGGAAGEVAFAARDRARWSPKVGVSWRAADALGLRAAGYRAFRAPTLNELYRPFQVGTILTAANPALGPETLEGAEAGADLTPPGTGLALRATGFWSRLSDPVSNVTLPAPGPDGAARERRNLGAARIRGLEASAEWRPSRRVAALGAYALTDAVVTSAPDAPAVVGRRMPQAPLHRVTASLAFDDPRLLAAAVEARWTGTQYEDDRNELPIAGYAVVNLFAARRVARGVEVYAAAENLLDRSYGVGRAGVDTLGAPRTVRAGVRISTR